MTSPVRAPRPNLRPHPAAAPAEHVRPDLRIVREPRRRSRSGLVVAFVTVVVFGALLAGAVAHSLLVGGQVHLDQTNADIRHQEQLLQAEKLELAELRSPERITAAAQRLGMVEAPDDGGPWLSPGADAPTTAQVDPGADEVDQVDPGTDQVDPSTDEMAVASGATSSRP